MTVLLHEAHHSDATDDDHCSLVLHFWCAAWRGFRLVGPGGPRSCSSMIRFEVQPSGSADARSAAIHGRTASRGVATGEGGDDGPRHLPEDGSDRDDIHFAHRRGARPVGQLGLRVRVLSCAARPRREAPTLREVEEARARKSHRAWHGRAAASAACSVDEHRTRYAANDLGRASRAIRTSRLQHVQEDSSVQPARADDPGNEEDAALLDTTGDHQSALAAVDAKPVVVVQPGSHFRVA